MYVCACDQQCVLVQFVCVLLYKVIHSYKLSLSFMCLSCDYHCLSSVARRLFNEECPLEILVDSAAEDRFSKLVLRDNVDGSIQVCVIAGKILFVSCVILLCIYETEGRVEKWFINTVKLGKCLD